MRLYELQKPNEITKLRKEITSGGVYNVSSSIGKYLEKYGFKAIGFGSFALVFKRPKDDYILKVFGENPGFIKWVAACNRHRDNPYLPKFIGKPILIKSTIHAIRMEVLKPLDNQAYDWAVEILVGSPVTDWDKLNEMSDKIVRKVFPDYLNDEHLKQAISVIHEVAETHRLDIHDENIMMRGNQMVFTDPIAG